MTTTLGVYGLGGWVDRLKNRYRDPEQGVRCIDLRDLDQQLFELFGPSETASPVPARARWLSHQLSQARAAGLCVVVMGVRDGDDIEALRAEGVRVVAVAGDQIEDDLDVVTLMHQVPVECLLNQVAIERYVEGVFCPRPSQHRVLSAQMALLYAERESETGCGVLHSLYATESQAVAFVYLTLPKLSLELVTASTAPPLWVHTLNDPGPVLLHDLLNSVASARETPIRWLEPAVGTVKALRPQLGPSGSPVSPGPLQAGAVADLIDTDAMWLGDIDLGLDGPDLDVDGGVAVGRGPGLVARRGLGRGARRCAAEVVSSKD